MSWSVFLPQLAVMAIVTYLIRMLPLAAMGLCTLAEKLKKISG